MPEDEQSTESTPVTEALLEAPQVQEPEVEAHETETEAQPEPKTYTSWKEALADADPEELLKDDRIAGRIGQVADKRAREIAAQQKAADDQRKQQEADRAEEQRLRNLRAQNPVAYATEMERKDASTDAIREEARRQAALNADITGNLAEYVKQNYTKEVYESLAGKTYEGSMAQGVTAYIDELNKAERTHLRAQWERDELPALRKKVLAELNGGEPPIDSSAAEVRPGKRFNSHLEASQALYANSLDPTKGITIQEYTRQAYQNGWR